MSVGAGHGGPEAFEGAAALNGLGAEWIATVSTDPVQSDLTSQSREMSKVEVRSMAYPHDGINNLFLFRRHQVPAVQYRAARIQAFQVWAEVTGVTAAA